MEKWKQKILPWIGFLPMMILAICVGISLNGYTAPVFDVVKAQEAPDNKEKTETSAVKEGTTQTEESTQMETAKEGGTYKDGTYTGTGKGFGGQMTVRVTIKNGKITEVKILNHKDGASYISKASSILSAIVKKQSTNVDTVSGATYSSVGIIQATRNALSKAMADGATLEETSALPATTTSSGSANGGSKTVSKVKDADGYKDGTYTGTGTGFGGKMTVQVVVKNGKIVSAKILNHKDGSSYINKAKSILSAIVSKQSTNVDTVSGATYSSKGIIEAVRNALNKAAITKKETTAETETEEETTTKAPAPTIKPVKEDGTYKDGTYTGTGTGFGGEMKLKVTIKKGKITKITVISKKDDEPFFTNAKALFNTIIKKQSTNVDKVSGATYSSNGIIEAVRDALSKAKTTKEETSATKETTTKAPAPTVKPVKEDGTYKDGTYEGTGTGFGGEMKLKVTVKNSKITKITVVSKKDDEPFFTNAKALFNTIIKKQSTNVDVISGATYSSNGIIEAVRNALSKAKVKNEETSATEETTTKVEETIPQGKFPYKNGAYFGTAEGFRSDITVAVVIRDKTIINIIVTDEDDDPAFFNRAEAVIDTILKKQEVDVDVVSGATFSSNGIIDAVKEALVEAKKVTEGETEESTTQAPETSTTTESPKESETSTTTESPKETETTTEKNTIYKDGTYSGSAKCKTYNYTINLKVTIVDDKITAVTDITAKGQSDSDDYYINRATTTTTKRQSMQDKIVEANSADVDTVSGATFTSDAIKEAVKAALNSAKR